MTKEWEDVIKNGNDAWETTNVIEPTMQSGTRHYILNENVCHEPTKVTIAHILNQ